MIGNHRELLMRFYSVFLLFIFCSPATADVLSTIKRDDQYRCVRLGDGVTVTTSARQDVVAAACAIEVERSKKAHDVVQGTLHYTYRKPGDAPAPEPTPDPAPVPTPPVEPPKPPEPTPQPTVRINVGGKAYTDAAGNVWAADTSTVGTADKITDAIANTVDDGLYQDFRYDFADGPEISYELALPNGDYVVDTLLAENYKPLFAAGVRTFAIEVQGVASEPIDMFARAGALTAFAVRLPAKVTDGKLTVRYLHRVENPSISALAVYPAGTAPPVLSPPAPAAATGSAMLSWTAPTTNTDASPLTDLSGYEVLYGPASLPTVVMDVPGADTKAYEVRNLPSGTWTFAVRAKNAGGSVSALSNIATKTIP